MGKSRKPYALPGLYPHTECFIAVTTPHVVDPKNPGAVDEIVHLGDHWNPVIPGLNLAVVNSVEPHYYKPQDGDVVVDTMTCVRPVSGPALQAERDTAREMYRRCMEEAVDFIHRAKKVHDEMEAYYIPNMNFQDIEARRQKVLARILELAEEVNGQ